MLRNTWRYFILFASLSLLGCGSGKTGGYTIEGTVTKGGQPYTPPAGESIALCLTSSANAGKSFGSTPGPDGNFKIDRVEAGSYNVSVMYYTEPKKTSQNVKKSQPPVMKLTGLKWDVTSNNRDFSLDLDKVK